MFIKCLNQISCRELSALFILISSGASNRNVNPLSGSSNWWNDTPRSAMSPSMDSTPLNFRLFLRNRKFWLRKINLLRGCIYSGILILIKCYELSGLKPFQYLL